MSAASEEMSTRSFSEISEDEYMIRIGVDLVAAAKRNLVFLRLISESHWLHQKHTLLEAIRRYDKLWMPLVFELMVGSTPAMVLPPLDIEWVWYCHTLNPVSYRQYCEERFSMIIGKPAIFNVENEDYAYNRCRYIWTQRYPSEPFENEVDSSPKDFDICNDELLCEVSKHRWLYTKFSEPYMSELVYLISAKRRFKAFLYMLQRSADGCSRLVPSADILLMWLTHQSYPTVYVADVKDMEGIMWKVVGPFEEVKKNELEETNKLWEKTFDEPYEKAGGETIGGVLKVKPCIYWEVTDIDVNTKYKSMLPRFVLEVCILVKLNRKTNTITDKANQFLRFRVLRCHRELKLSQPLSGFEYNAWKKVWHLYSEFGTKGVQLELRHPGGRCFKGSSLLDKFIFTWNDLLRAPSLSLGKEINQKARVVASITPPVQASYLLKCVSDRVTDDSGAMISDIILKMNQYRPQEGRWLSRTVLDHAGRECFVVRMRIGRGFWRRGGEAPAAVKWEERIIEIREGSWSYAAGSIGRSPEKVVGTALPKAPPEGWQASWSFSTGDDLLIKWGSTTSVSDLCFDLKSQTSSDSWLRILKGRQMQSCNTIITDEHNPEDDGFVTLVRYTEENPNGKATALLNWKLLLVDFLPEEDAAFVLLLCISILRSVSEMRKEDFGGLLIRRRLKEAKFGARDWGSVVLHPSSCSPFVSSPYVQHWYGNPKAMMASDVVDMMRPIGFKYSAEDGGDNLYKRVILP